MAMGTKGMKKFVARSLLALLPVVAYVVLYLVLDPFRVVHRYDGVSIAPGDTIERMPNKRYVAVEGLKYYNPTHHYDAFIFGSSISSNFTAAAWKRHLPDSARVYHFTAGAETLSGIRDELKYLVDNGYNVRHALFIMEEEMFRRPRRYEEMPFVPHYDVSPVITRLHFHRVHFNAFRDPYMFAYQLMPSLTVDRLLADGKIMTVPSGRDEVTNEDSSYALDTLIQRHSREFYADLPWLKDMPIVPYPMPLSIDADAEASLRDIARLLQDNGIDYLVIVPPRYMSQPLSLIDRGLLCDIMGKDKVNDFSNDSTLIHDMYSYYDGIHILTHRCSELIDRSYSRRKWGF